MRFTPRPEKENATVFDINIVATPVYGQAAISARDSCLAVLLMLGLYPCLIVIVVCI